MPPMCAHVLSTSRLQMQEHTSPRSYYGHVRLTFRLLSERISKVIILWLPPHYLPTKAAAAQSPDSTAKAQIFEWQLVNDVITILLVKWSSGYCWLASYEETIICYGWCVWGDGWRVTLGERHCWTVLLEENEDDEPVSPLFIWCTRRLMGQRLITFADTCSAVTRATRKNDGWLSGRD